MNYFKTKVRPVSTKKALEGLMTEEQLGENIREACNQLGWKFYWLRKTQHSSEGILDLLLVPLNHVDRRHTLFRELKGHDRNGRLGQLSVAQVDTISILTEAREDAALWVPADWYSGKILEELSVGSCNRESRTAKAKSS